MSIVNLWRHVFNLCTIAPCISLPVLLPLRHPVPVEHQVPVEAPDGEVGGLLVGEGVVVDDVDDGTHHVGGVPRYPVQQRLQPALSALAVAEDNVSRDM